MTFEDEFTAAVRREAKKVQQRCDAENAAALAARRKKLAHGSSFLRVIVGGKTGAYDLGPENDPDGIMVTLRK
jgi:mitochondrial fission protein ELM1